MKRISLFMILIACPVAAFAQGGGMGWSGTAPSQSTQSAVLPTAGMGCGGGDYGYAIMPQTVEGAALQGRAQVINATGQYNQATSAAAVNLTQAESNQLRNALQGVRTMWELHDIYREERQRELGPRPTPEELIRRARAAAPRPLNSSQMDPVSGELYWPPALLDPGFEAQRVALDECAARWARYGTLDYVDRAQIRENIQSMYATLKSQIGSIPPQDYVASRTFLQSLMYATTRGTI